MRHVITPRVGQFLSAWGGYILVAVLFRTMTSQAPVTARNLVQAAVVGLLVALAVDYLTRRRTSRRTTGRRRRR